MPMHRHEGARASQDHSFGRRVVCGFECDLPIIEEACWWRGGSLLELRLDAAVCAGGAHAECKHRNAVRAAFERCSFGVAAMIMLAVVIGRISASGDAEPHAKYASHPG